VRSLTSGDDGGSGAQNNYWANGIINGTIRTQDRVVKIGRNILRKKYPCV
jgi:hypothetical protein